tara:strand:- start:81 stop:533 length:453 start_codon:yes stop_codon:yes gene_type:complete
MEVLGNLSEEMKNAMKAKDSLKLESLRAIKSAVLLAKTSSSGGKELTDEDLIKLLQRLVKQRKDSAAIFYKQGRDDLAKTEEAQSAIIASFLPEQLSKEEVFKIVEDIILKTEAEGMKDMGKVMGLATKQLGGKAEGKLIATLVKQLLSS